MQQERNYPLVSVVIGTYNGEAYLKEQLDSVFSQAYPNLEVIVSDDCSTDSTLSILHSYAERHSNMKLLQNKTNKGYIKNFEAGMEHAAGKYIAVCDQDDVWLDNKIMLMVEAIGDYPALYCDSYLVDESLNLLAKQQLSAIKNLATYTSCLVFATDNCVAGHATLITNEFFKKIKPFHTTIAHDWWFAYMATFYGGIKYLDVPLIKYRNHASNIIGAVKVNRARKTIAERIEQKKAEREKAQARVKIFYDNCPDSFAREKKVIGQLVGCYRQKSFASNCKRVALYLKHKEYFLAIKKSAGWYKTFFCFKMFFKTR